MRARVLNSFNSQSADTRSADWFVSSQPMRLTPAKLKAMNTSTKKQVWHPTKAVWARARARAAEKGGAARQHIGMTVQRAIEILRSHGLDPFAYGFICYDQWGELPEIRDAAADRGRKDQRAPALAGPDVLVQGRVF